MATKIVAVPIHDSMGSYCPVWVVQHGTKSSTYYSRLIPGNVFSLGDCSNVPTAKTAAAVAAESHVLKHNLLEVMKGNTPSRKVCRPPSP